MLGLVAERIDIAVQSSEHTAAEEQGFGLGMDWGTLMKFLAWQKS